MRHPIFTVLFLLACPLAHAQEVISASGGSYSTGSITISQTVGEAVIGTVSNGLSVEQGFHNDHILITAILEEDPRMAITVFPNPVLEQLRIEGELPIKGLELFDITGKLVLGNSPAGGPHQITLDLSGFAPGQYLLKVTTIENGPVNTYQLIKQ